MRWWVALSGHPPTMKLFSYPLARHPVETKTKRKRSSPTQQCVPWGGKRVLLPGLAHADRQEQVAIQALLARRNDDADVLVARGIVEVPAGNLAKLNAR